MNEPINLRNPTTEWEKPIWAPEPIFKGETVFCLACGPSLTPQICESLRGRRVIAVNSAVYLAPWADVLFFTDAGWFEAANEAGARSTKNAAPCGWPGNDVWPRRKLIEGFAGLVMCFAPIAKRVLDDPSNPYPMARRPRILRLKACGAATAPPMKPGAVGYVPGFWRGASGVEIWPGRNSGQTAISLAIALGAARVALVGYDMKVVGGREHFHKDYLGGRDLTIYANEFLPAFRGWNAAALAEGAEVLNCTEGSAITEFPFAKLEALL